MSDFVDSVVALIGPQAWVVYAPDAPELQDPDSPPERPYVVANGGDAPRAARRLSGRGSRQPHNVTVKIVGDSAASCRLLSGQIEQRLERARPTGLSRPTPLTRVSSSEPMKDRGFKPPLFVLTDVYRFATNAPLPEGVTP